MNVKTVSMKQLREDFPAVKQLLETGEELLLIYRSYPLAEIKPVKGLVSQVKARPKAKKRAWDEFLAAAGIGKGPKDLSYNHDKYFAAKSLK